MFVGDIFNWQEDRHIYPAVINRGIDYIRSTDLSKLEPGKYPLLGNLMFALIQETVTSPKDERIPESHQTYVDIQCLLTGEERIGVSRLGTDCIVSENLLAERDLLFYSAVGAETDVMFKPGTFAVFFPQDIHRPCCSVNEAQTIKKVVIKIHKDLFDEKRLQEALAKE